MEDQYWMQRRATQKTTTTHTDFCRCWAQLTDRVWQHPAMECRGHGARRLEDQPGVVHAALSANAEDADLSTFSLELGRILSELPGHICGQVAPSLHLQQDSSLMNGAIIQEEHEHFNLVLCLL